jgi:NAD(P)H-flavin reductase
MVKGATKADGKFDARPYTPTTLNDEKGHFELIIKSYPEGNVSKHLHSLKVFESRSVGTLFFMHDLFQILSKLSISLRFYTIFA